MKKTVGDEESSSLAEESNIKTDDSSISEQVPQEGRGDVHSRAKRGIKLLMGRQVFLQIITLLGGVILARTLDPAQFGLYTIATFIVGTIGLLGDFGLAPSFIQQKEELNESDLWIGFTLQQIVTTIVVVALIVFAPWLAALYPKAPPETVWLVRALALTLYLTSWRSMSALQLERQLRYDRLAWIEVVEILCYQAIAVGLALTGYGVWSFVWATLARGLLGAGLVYLAAPWSVRFAFDLTAAHRILRFGVPFQTAIIVNQINDWVTPILVGALIGPQAVGLLTWGSSNGKKPLIPVANVMRVAFPHFSRVQDDRSQIEYLMVRYLTYLLLPAGLWFTVLAFAGPSLVRWIYTDKWADAVPALILYSAGVSFEVIGWVSGNTLMSLGRVRTATFVILIRAVLTISLSIPLVLMMGFNGVPLAALIGSVTVLPWMLEALGRGTMRRILGSVAWLIYPVIAGSLAGALLWRLPLSLVWHALTLSIAVGTIYLAASWLLCPVWLKNAIAAKIPVHRFRRVF